MKKIISTKDAPKAIGPYSQGVLYQDMLFISGQIPIDPGTGNLVGGGIEIQTRQVLENLKAVVEACGMNLGNVLKCTCFLKQMDDFSVFNTVYGTYFRENPPARETLEVSRIPKDALVEISAICGR
ncbi:MAG: RidA family protein [Thermodesulfobacteriota bacterium]